MHRYQDISKLMPNFLIIGAAKAGTTSLYACLEQHPQIYMSPVKETNFFALEGESLDFYRGSVNQGYLQNCQTTLEQYTQQFQGVTQQSAVGEASPIYLYHPKAPERISHYLPEVKLIAILRHPVERAYSNFLHHIRDNLETHTDFIQAIEAEEKRIQEHWWWGFHYTEAGFYARQLELYFKYFKREQIRVYLYEDFRYHNLAILKDIFQFLEVEPDFIPDTSGKHNVTGIPRNKLWYRFLTQPSWVKEPLKFFIPKQIRQNLSLSLKNRSLAKPELARELKQQLTEVYREDILHLQDLLHRDLSMWLE